VHGDQAELEALMADGGELVEGRLPDERYELPACAPSPAVINYL
jgi:hypothetical protein